MKRIFSDICAAGGNIYLVGGSVRDALLGVPPKDEDYLVCGIHFEHLLKILNAHGHAMPVGQAFGVIKFKWPGTSKEYDFALPRTEKSTGTGHTDFEIQSDPFLPIEIDLQRRDFTVNAIAMNIHTEEIVDPFNGRQDIVNKILRPVSDKSFEEDPLRMLRGIQFVARFNFTPGEHFLEMAERNKHLITSVAPERISMEINKMLAKADKPSIGFRLMLKTGILKIIMPELAACDGMPQPTQYHAHDVLGHILEAVDRIPVRKGKTVQHRLMALLHDPGKLLSITFKESTLTAEEVAPACHAREKILTGNLETEYWPAIELLTDFAWKRINMFGGKLVPTFPEHDILGAKMARHILTRLKFASDPAYSIDVDRICFAVEHHMFACSCDSSDKSIRKFVVKAKTAGRPSEVLGDQIRLRIADRLAKGLPNTDVNEWLTFFKRCRTIGHGATAAFSIKELAITGNDVMEVLNIKPGKQVGETLKRLFEMVVDDPTLNCRDKLIELIKA